MSTLPRSARSKLRFLPNDTTSSAGKIDSAIITPAASTRPTARTATVPVVSSISWQRPVCRPPAALDRSSTPTARPGPGDPSFGTTWSQTRPFETRAPTCAPGIRASGSAPTPTESYGTACPTRTGWRAVWPIRWWPAWSSTATTETLLRSARRSGRGNREPARVPGTSRSVACIPRGAWPDGTSSTRPAALSTIPPRQQSPFVRRLRKQQQQNPEQRKPFRVSAPSTRDSGNSDRRAAIRISRRGLFPLRSCSVLPS
mmetsp:Transcript_34682/g.72705  ORF Transcript_34682/g.72705 Transcript_34682/m.72705 type:complete len:258 (-) Transcript_34682:1095-1868(-)